ncbi:TetR/AcrR family transcriptional regulator [Antrihabitans sp. YC2-6]|uniref:TetR/AcrR family transcriptional regulator n=1 Tax=Antrihabitans sp. YC2-6 TaxID=2799498 RepID=UPI0018F694DB|nr:TetR/AcrR family transcriptional regulator [Antrihabitans sp. YC2-6]MBJ8344144.1 TetR/AcrR family transcriptional regulator [Antrihabitans sp. YC2-6]
MSVSTRDRILDALEALMLDGGLSQITLEAVAAKAGVSKGGLLYHFPSKEDLFAGMARRMGDRYEQQFTEVGGSVAEWYLRTADDPEEAALYRSLIAVLRSVDGSEGLVQRAVIDSMAVYNEALQAEIGDPVQAEIVRLVGDGVFLAGLLGMPAPEPELYAKVVERLLGRGE